MGYIIVALMFLSRTCVSVYLTFIFIYIYIYIDEIMCVYIYI